MATNSATGLTPDDIDDLLYFTRTNETNDLQQTITDLAAKFQCTPKDVVEAAIDPENGNTVLHYSSANGHADLVTNFLTILGVSQEAAHSILFVNHQNKEGNTPLHWAAYNGHLPVCKQLVAAGADMWMKNAAGHLAMFEAERADKNEVVQYLLEAGGKEVEQTGHEGQADDEDAVDVDGEEVSFTMKAGETGEGMEEA